MVATGEARPRAERNPWSDRALHPAPEGQRDPPSPHESPPHPATYNLTSTWSPTFAPECEYDLSATPRSGATFVCPECGKPIPAWRARFYARKGDPTLRRRTRRLLIANAIAATGAFLWYLHSSADPLAWVTAGLVLVALTICLITAFSQRRARNGHWPIEGFLDWLGWILITLLLGVMVGGYAVGAAIAILNHFDAL